MNISCDEIRMGIFEEEIITDELLNSPEFIPLADSELKVELKNRGVSYDELDESQKDIFKIAVLEKIRAKCCSYMSIYILNEAKRVDKSDIKYEKYATVQDWKNQAQLYLNKSNEYLNKISNNTTTSGVAQAIVVPWGC